MSDFVKLKKELPNKESFIVLWLVEKISDKEYEHVRKVWNTFEMETMKDYNILYLKIDVLLLAGVFEKFRNGSLKSYGLSLSHYLRAPVLSCHAVLNMTKIELELISDADMYLLFEKVWEVEFLTFLKDTVKSTISI